jgi:hypothetical protein
MIPGRQPCSRKRFTNHNTNGVLPLPPTVRLPTTTTGTGKRCERSSAAAVQPASQHDQSAEQPGKRQQGPECQHQTALVPAAGQALRHTGTSHQGGDWVANEIRG